MKEITAYAQLVEGNNKNVLTSNDLKFLVKDPFEIILYTFTGDDNLLDKTSRLSNPLKLTGYLRQETSIVNPTIVFEGYNLKNYNYCFIKKFNRYYFVKDIVSVRTNLWSLSMNCDVLMSYKDEIKELEALIARNENEYDLDIKDDAMLFSYEKDINYKEVLPPLDLDLYQFRNNIDNVGLNGASIVINTISSSADLIVTETHPDIRVLKPSNYPTPNFLNGSFDNLVLGDSNYDRVNLLRKDDEEGVTKLTGMMYIVDNTINDSSLASYIKYLAILPIQDQLIYNFWKDKYNKTQGKLETHLWIKDKIIGNDDKENPKFTPTYKASINILPPFLNNVININNLFDVKSDFRRFEPFSKYYIYIPFADFIEVNAIDVLNKDLYLYYYFDFINGKSYYILTSKNEVIATDECQAFLKVSISSDNLNEITDRGNQALMTNALSSLASMAQGISYGSLFGPAGAMVGAVGGVTQLVTGTLSTITETNINKEYRQAKVGGMTSNGKMIFSKQPIVKRVSYNTIFNYENADYRHLYGVPLNKTKKIGDLTGFTSVGNIHLDNISATTQEKEELENILKDGFII